MMAAANRIYKTQWSVGALLSVVMIRFPTRVRHVPTLGRILATSAGRIALCRHDETKTNAIYSGAALAAAGLSAASERHLFAISHDLQALARQTQVKTLDYIILVPTLRCNLSCSYCQVSRAPIDQPKFDWTPATLAHVITVLDNVESDNIKVEFQGGEPTLRLDLVEQVITACERFARKQFVLCTNLHRIDEDLWRLLENPDVYVSTSLDGSTATHSVQRTGSEADTAQFLANAEAIVARFGEGKLSALPTINQLDPPEPDTLIDAFLRLGQKSIFLRPINYQGFARKRHRASADDHSGWWHYYETVVMRMVARNYADRNVVLDETYLTLMLRRIFQIGHDRHVDLRNPNPVGVDYVLIDYDGAVYPTDEARMLTRAGVIDLRIGDTEAGWDTPERAALHHHSTNLGDPACDACVYQPFCGRDVIDDLSRYGTIDMHRHDTFFCQKHMYLFDLCMRLIYSDDDASQYSLAKWLGLAGERLPPMPVLA